jgi:hypothetical protein
MEEWKGILPNIIYIYRIIITSIRYQIETQCNKKRKKMNGKIEIPAFDWLRIV